VSHPIIAIVGPTACGKTKRAVELASAINAEIISADSRQIYRGMDLGTGKDLNEYGKVPYHLIDIRPAGYKYNLYEYLADYEHAEEDITSRGRRVILCGGTGMYVEAVLDGVKMPEVPANHELRNRLAHHTLQELTSILSKYKTLHNTTDVDTCARAIRAIEIEEYYAANPERKAMADKNRATKRDAVIIGLDISRDDRRRRISERLRERMEQGMLAEVQSLLDCGISPEDLIYYGLEYKFMTLHLTGRLSYQEMFDALEIAIHQFAKRQMTWWRGMERRGHHINWLPYDLPATDFINRVLPLAMGKTKIV